MTKICISKILQFSPAFKRTDRLRVLSESLGLDKNKVEAIFALYIANTLRERVKKSIIFQKVNGVPMKFIYAPLSKKYQEKKPTNTRSSFYRNTDWLLKNIKVYKYAGKYYIGYTATQKHPNSKAKAQDILVWNEKGTSRTPARPLITPNARFIFTRLDKYYDRFERLLIESELKYR